MASGGDITLQVDETQASDRGNYSFNATALFLDDLDKCARGLCSFLFRIQINLLQCAMTSSLISIMSVQLEVHLLKLWSDFMR